MTHYLTDILFIAYCAFTVFGVIYTMFHKFDIAPNKPASALGCAVSMIGMGSLIFPAQSEVLSQILMKLI